MSCISFLFIYFKDTIFLIFKFLFFCKAQHTSYSVDSHFARQWKMKDKSEKNPYVPSAHRKYDSTANNIYYLTPDHHDEFLKICVRDAPKVSLYLQIPLSL